MNRQMVMTKKLLFSLFVVLFMLSGCKLKRPDDVLSPKEMEKILYDYHLAQAIMMEESQSEKYKRDYYLEWVYQKNGITKQEFDRSLVWYTRYPDEFAEIYEKLSERVSKDRNQAAMLLERIEKSSFSVESGDSVDLWYLNNNAILANSVYLDKILFSIKADTTFYSGDTITWSVNNTLVSKTDSLPLQVYLALSMRYSNSRVITVDTLLNNSAKVELITVIDSVSDLSTITGFVSYVDSTNNKDACAVLTDISLIRQR